MRKRDNLFVKEEPESTNACLSILKRFYDVWRGQNLKHVDLDTLGALRARAVAFQIGISFLHVSQIVTESGSWFETPTMCEGKSETTAKFCVGSYNEELLDPLRSVTWLMMRFLVFVSIIICFAYCKWKWIADYIILMQHALAFTAVFHLNAEEAESATRSCVLFSVF